MIPVSFMKDNDYGETMFVTTFDTIMKEVHWVNTQNGWWDSNRGDPEAIALIHSELSEALVGLQHGNPADDKIPEFSSAEAEMADTVIRIMDLCYHRGWRLPEAVLRKIEFNRTRGHKHGGKKF